MQMLSIYVSTLSEQAIQLAYLYADHIKHMDFLFHKLNKLGNNTFCKFHIQ